MRRFESAVGMTKSTPKALNIVAQGKLDASSTSDGAALGCKHSSESTLKGCNKFAFLECNVIDRDHALLNVAPLQGADLSFSYTQGGSQARTTHPALPWATMLNAFSDGWARSTLRVPTRPDALGDMGSPLRGWRILAMLLAVSCFSICFAAEPLEQTVESGPVKATVTLEPAKPVIGDTVTLTITVAAEKDVEVLMPEFGEALDQFSIVDFVPRESINDDGQNVATQKYRLQPPSSGLQAIPPILIEYVDRRDGQRPAPDGLDAYELLTERLQFEVKSVLPKDAKADLKPPMGKLEPKPEPRAARWPWLVAAFVVLAIASPFVVRAWMVWRRLARRRSAYEIARSRLNKLLASHRTTDEQVGAFYVELSNIVRRYLEDRFEMRAPELTTEEFLTSVGQSPDLSLEHQTLLREFLRQADLVKFARVHPSAEDVEQSISAARRFLEETRENAPLIDEESRGSQPSVVG